MAEANFNRLTEKYKDWEIDRQRLVRRPLPQAFHAAQWLVGKKRPPHHDRLFHLFTEFRLRHPETGEKAMLMLERNQTLNAEEHARGHEGKKHVGGLAKGHEAVEVQMVDPHYKGTLGDYLENWREQHEHQGKDWRRYDVRTNNCQQFLRSGLIGNNMHRPSYEAFTNQRVDELVPKWAGFFANRLTDSAKGADMAVGTITS